MLKPFFKTVPFCRVLCKGSGFIEKDHRYIVTGDLRIVENNKLRKLFTKGAKYRENNNILCEKAKFIII